MRDQTKARVALATAELESGGSFRVRPDEAEVHVLAEAILAERLGNAGRRPSSYSADEYEEAYAEAARQLGLTYGARGVEAA